MIFSLTTAFLLLPSVEDAVILTVLPFPAFFACTTPFWVTVAYFSLLLVHVMDLFVAFEGSSLAVSNIFLPAAIFLEIPVILILLTFTSCSSLLSPLRVPVSLPLSSVDGVCVSSFSSVDGVCVLSSSSVDGVCVPPSPPIGGISSSSSLTRLNCYPNFIVILSYIFSYSMYAKHILFDCQL